MPIFNEDVEIQDGNLILKDGGGEEKARIESSTGKIIIREVGGKIVIKLDRQGDIRLGGSDQAGNISMLNKAGEETIRMNGGVGDILLGGGGQAGNVSLRNDDGDETIRMNGGVGDIRLGGGGQAGNVSLRNDDGDETIRMNGGVGNILLGGGGQVGNVSVRNDKGKETISINGGVGDIRLGGSGRTGNVSVRNKKGEETIRMNGGVGNITLGGNGEDGDVSVRNKKGEETIRLDGNSGDIILKSADCAEDFDVDLKQNIEPGTVMVLNQEGELCQSTEPYDRKVVGVISGAGDFKPGIILDRNQSQNKRVPLALMGKVYCKVDAQHSSLEVGDLLTTSATPGHAMKADDPLKAFGTVIGKALRPLPKGKGLIPILIALQ